jgi:hypothetical protein
MNRPVLLPALLIMFAGIQRLTPQVSGSIESYLPPVKVIESNSPEPGYFFISSRVLNPRATNAYHFVAIVDNYGTLIYYKRNYLGNGGFRLQKNGYLTFMPYWPGMGFGYFVLDSSYNRIDTLYMLGYEANQHDFKISEDGHALFIGNYYRDVDMSQIVEGGDPNARTLEAIIQEFDSSGNLLLEWRSWEHFDILDANELSVNFKASTVDYVHPNGIEFDSDTSILLSSRHLDEITKIDRRTGEVIWRLGGKKNQFGFINDTIGFSTQHSIIKLDNGNIMLLDNGNYHTPPSSSAVEYSINEDSMEVTLIKRYRPDFDIFASFGCNAQKLKGGNILMGLGETSPSLIELRPDNSVALIMDFSDYASSLLITKQPWKTNLFTTNTDTIIFPKYEYMTYYYQLKLSNKSGRPLEITDYSTHTESFYIDEDFPFTIPAGGDTIIDVAFNPLAEGYITDVLTINSDIVSDTLIQRAARQVYLSGTSDDFSPPLADISPSDEGSVPLDAKIYIEFNELVRYVDNSEIDYTNIKTLLTFKKTDEQGEDVDFIVTVSTDKKLITLKPTSYLEEEQAYFVAIAKGLEDYSDNPADSVSATFTTADIDPPQVQIYPADGSTGVPTILDATAIFNEPVRLTDNREIDNTNVDSVITLKESEGQMSHVPFDATINAGKTKITIVPDSELEPYTGYNIIIRDVEDYSDNTLSGNMAQSYFTTGASAYTPVITKVAGSQYIIYPNPSNGKFAVDFGSRGKRLIKVYNFAGRLLFSKTSDGMVEEFDFQGLPPGIFFIEIIHTDAPGKVLLKVIIE